MEIVYNELALAKVKRWKHEIKLAAWDTQYHSRNPMSQSTFLALNKMAKRFTIKKWKILDLVIFKYSGDLLIIYEYTLKCCNLPQLFHLLAVLQDFLMLQLHRLLTYILLLAFKSSSKIHWKISSIFVRSALPCMLCILTSKRVLHTPFAGRNRLSEAKTTFSITNGTK